MREMRALYALLPHPDIARVEGDVEARRAGAEHHHAAPLHDQAGDREGLFTGMLEDDVHVVALAGDVPDGLAEAARLLEPVVVFRRIHLGHLTPAFEVLAVDDALGAEAHDEIGLGVIRDDADRIGAGRGAELHAEEAEAARGAPDQHIVARPQPVPGVAEQHAVGGGQRQRVAGRFLPGQVLRPRHELAGLDARELREGTVRRLVAPDALRGREHRVAAIALLVVAVVLVAVDHDLVADLPARDLRAHGPDDAGRVRARHVIGLLVHVVGRDRLAEPGPDAVVVDPGGHDEDQDLVGIDLPGRQHLHLHGLVGRPVALLADGPGVHALRHMAERRALARLVEGFGRGARAPIEADFHAVLRLPAAPQYGAPARRH